MDALVDLRKASRRNTQCHWVTVFGVDVLFSYGTPIAFYGKGCCRRNNDWGPTTGRHMREADVLSMEVVTEDVFVQRLNAAILEQIVKDKQLFANIARERVADVLEAAR